MANQGTRRRIVQPPQVIEDDIEQQERAAALLEENDALASAPNADRGPMHIAPGADAREPSHEPVHASPRVRTRQSHATARANPFDLPKDEIPEGSSYEWKRFSVMGQSADHDPFYLSEMRRQGWEPVDPRRHPNWVPPGYDKPTIIRDGLILMERPIELTNDARQEQKQMARAQMREAQERLGLAPRDTMTRDFDGIRPRVERQIMRPVPIED
jgi:hypothetical protein